MRTLGEQWIVEIDGIMHMVKLCQSNPKEISTCGGCIYHSWNEGDWCDMAPLKPCGEVGYIIKDLGPVNEDRLLACPFCGEQLKIIDWTNGFYAKCSNVACAIGVTNSFPTKQELINKLNRRAM